MITYGEMVREARKQLGETQRELSDRLEMPHGSISCIERETWIPSLAITERIAEALDVQLGPLWRARRTEA